MPKYRTYKLADNPHPVARAIVRARKQFIDGDPQDPQERLKAIEAKLHQYLADEDFDPFVSSFTAPSRCDVGELIGYDS
jgi:hypothetical protein